MSSDVDICNLALGFLGDEAEVAALTESSAQAAYCKRFYPMARDTVLQMGQFGFSLRRAALAEDLVDDVPNSWSFAYTVPNGCISKIALLPPNATNDTTDMQDYAVEAIDDAGHEVIYTNQEQAVLRYVQRVTDTTRFQPLVVIAIARLLASYLAGPLIKGSAGTDIGLKQMEIFMKTSMPAAVADDANSQQTDQMGNFVPSMIKARNTNDATAFPPFSQQAFN